MWTREGPRSRTLLAAGAGDDHDRATSPCAWFLADTRDAGSVPRDNPEELIAYEVMRRTLGVTFTTCDDRQTAGRVDGEFTHTDGTLGAVEVTMLCDPRMRQVADALRRLDGMTIDGGRWAWHVSVGKVSIAALAVHLPAVLAACEAADADDVRRFARAHRDHPSCDWFVRADVGVFASRTTSRPGRVYFVAGRSTGGFLVESLAGLAAAMPAVFEWQQVPAKIAKLRANGRPDLHLFLYLLDTSALSWALWERVAFGSDVPAEPLDAPSGITGVWLATGYRQPLLWWSVATGWRRTTVYDEPAVV